MADGPAVHRLANRLAALRARPLRVTGSDPSAAEIARALGDCVLRDAEAVGKHLLLHCAGGAALHVHLGGAGRLLHASDAGATGDDEGARLVLHAGAERWTLSNPAVCEVVGRRAADALRARVGPDPLRGDADPEVAWERVHAHPGEIGFALLDQSTIGGCGNALGAEVLHDCRVNPLVAASSVRRAEFDCLWEALGRRMRAALDAPGGVDAARLPGRVAVYRRKRCLDCGRPVQRARIHRRTAYYCPACQRAAA